MLTRGTFPLRRLRANEPLVPQDRCLSDAAERWVSDMPRFFVEPHAVENGHIVICGEDAHHMTHVLRMRCGESVVVCVPDTGIEYETTFVSGGDPVLLQIVSEKRTETEPPYKAVVYQALCKGDKMETVIQKAVETGAVRIVPIITSRATVKWDPKDGARKVDRWQKIASEAAKQCGRGVIPTVASPMRFADTLDEIAGWDLPLFCYEGEGVRSLPRCTDAVDGIPEKIAIVVGPEGGFAPEEAEMARKRGIQMCGLGKRILRTETAAVFVLACLSQTYEM